MQLNPDHMAAVMVSLPSSKCPLEQGYIKLRLDTKGVKELTGRAWQAVVPFVFKYNKDFFWDRLDAQQRVIVSFIPWSFSLAMSVMRSSPHLEYASHTRLMSLMQERLCTSDSSHHSRPFRYFSECRQGSLPRLIQGREAGLCQQVCERRQGDEIPGDRQTPW